jgi:hypothetical protein
VVTGDTGDHLLDEHRLADTRAAEQADLPTLDVRGEEVDDLDAGLEDLCLALELVERRRVPVDRPALGDLQRGARHVQGLADRVEDVALDAVADRDRDRLTGVEHRRAADDAVGRLQGDGADHVVADVLGDLEGQRPLLPAERNLDLQGVVDLGHRLDRELDVDDGARDAGDPARRRGRCGLFYGSSHGGSHSLPADVSASAFAPPTISLISCVISA